MFEYYSWKEFLEFSKEKIPIKELPKFVFFFLTDLFLWVMVGAYLSKQVFRTKGKSQVLCRIQRKTTHQRISEFIFYVPRCSEWLNNWTQSLKDINKT